MIEQGLLRKVCRQTLEEAIILRLSKVKSLSLDRAMDIYYHSRLSQEVSQGAFGIDNLSPEYLVDDLIENESALFE